MNNSFKYTFLKSVVTEEIILIINIRDEWLDKEVEIFVKQDSLDIVFNHQKFNSGTLPVILSSWMKENPTKVFFANDEGKIVSESIIGEN